ncbi:MAG TPA: galactokinase [Tepidisphaeraceae bacterium]|jgi:galactokinase|nr:galactokinase [Tepidisphaeraceae bacterium]
MQIDTSDIKQQFTKAFGTEGGRVHVLRSPGRVNLIGEHTDYNDGFVFPMAIEPHVLFAFRARTDGLVRMVSTVYPDQFVEFSVNEPIERGEPKWSNYLRGAAAELVKAGIPLVGMDLLLDNTLPMGGGLSSSAALEVGTARALLALAGLEMDETRIALLAQKAEHEFALVPCGIMDQTIVTSGRAGHAMLLDCRDNSKTFIPLDSNELRVVIVNSMVKHELSGGEYAERRHQCEEGVAFFQKIDPNVKALRDVTMKQVEDAKGQLRDVVFRRCRHVVGENARATRYATLLSTKGYEQAGELMVQSHNSLRDDYNVSTPELDLLVVESMKVKGVYGARMTGGGFGGCIVALVQPRAVQALTDHLNKVYPEKVGEQPGIYVTTATNGTELIE